MREIKFRAWDNITKDWLRPYQIVYPFKWEDGYIVFNSCEMDNLTLMQYTGLKDKNGREIYEGDIVELRDNGIGTGYEYPVCWDEEDLTFKVGYAMLGGLDVEIVGNIYENKELLKG